MSTKKQQSRQPAKKAQAPRKARAPRGLASSTSLAPVSVAGRRSNYFSIVSGSKAGSIVIKGQDYLSSVTTGVVNSPGTLLANYPIAPSSVTFANTRVSTFATLYEKYLFKSLKFHYEPAVSTSTNGQIIIAYDRDASDAPPPVSDAGVHSYLAMQGAKMATIWRQETISCPLTDLQDFYYTNDTNEVRLSRQGQLFVAAMTNVPASTVIGSMWVEYEMMLFDAQLENNFVDLLASNNGVTNVNATAGQAWNTLLSSTNNPLDGPARFITDAASGNKGFKLSAGVYQLLQTYVSSTAATQIENPIFVPIAPGEVMNIVLLHGATSIIGSAGFRLSQITIPRGGGIIFGDVSTTTDISSYNVRLLSYNNNSCDLFAV